MAPSPRIPGPLLLPPLSSLTIGRRHSGSLARPWPKRTRVAQTSAVVLHDEIDVVQHSLFDDFLAQALERYRGNRNVTPNVARKKP
jgi:hypothetical protein